MSIQLEEQTMCFKVLSSGDKTLDALYFIKQLFEFNDFTDRERAKILDYFYSELEDSTFSKSIARLKAAQNYKTGS